MSEKEDPKYKWRINSIFASDADFYKACEAVKSDLLKIANFKDSLSNPSSLFDCLELNSNVQIAVYRIFDYGFLSQSLDNSNSNAQMLLDQAGAIIQKYDEANAFVKPELNRLPSGFLVSFLKDFPKLKKYEFYLDSFERGRKFIPSEEINQLYASALKVLGIPTEVHSLLTDADLIFKHAHDQNGNAHALNQGVIDELLSSNDGILRQNAWEAYADAFLEHKNTLATSIKGLCAVARFEHVSVKKHSSILEAKLFEERLAKDVFFHVIDSSREQQKVWRRYFKVKAKILGREKLRECDIHAPLSSKSINLNYDLASELVINSLNPLGADYVKQAQLGLYEKSWVDVYPRKNKSSNAFAAGSYSTEPFILLNYNNSFTEAGTLAHELGHAMHSLLTNSNQPPIYSNYSMIIAETASNFNQALLRKYLIEQNNPDWILDILDETFNNFHRYTFMFPILSRLEHEAHEAMLKDESITADFLISRCRELFSEAYGDALEVDPQRVGIRWSQFGHFFAPYYFYSYTLGIAAGNVLAEKIYQGDTDLRDRYLKMLASGNSMSTPELFAMVDIDLTSSKLILDTFDILNGYIDLLDKFVT